MNNSRDLIVADVNSFVDDCSVKSFTEHALDVDYVFDSRFEFKCAIVTVCTGGPHIELNTDNGIVTGYLSGETWSQYIDSDMNMRVHEWYEEFARSITTRR